METAKYGSKIYVRLDKGDRLIESIIETCKKQSVSSCIFSGIGACGEVSLATLDPATGEFHEHHQSGVLEILSLRGNIVTKDDGEPDFHAHALFSYLDERQEIAYFGGHLLEGTVNYTAELTLEPVEGGILGHKKDPETGVSVWKFSGQ